MFNWIFFSKLYLISSKINAKINMDHNGTTTEKGIRNKNKDKMDKEIILNTIDVINKKINKHADSQPIVTK